MRRLDELTIQQYGTPGHTLMQRAGAGASEVLLARFPRERRKHVLVVAGKGNNGGDGFVMARLLRRKGVRVVVALLGKQAEVRGDAARALVALRRTAVPLVEVTSDRDLTKLARLVQDATLLVDALFGTGLNAPVEGRYAEAIHLMNASGLPIFAVDIPSGLDADRGTPMGVAIRAAATATFGFAKIGQVTYPGVEYVGALQVVDIGIAPQAIESVHPLAHYLDAGEVASLVPQRGANTHKGTYGHVLIIAGSRGHTGAAVLAAHAACRAGAGLTTLAGPASLNSIYCSGAPEVMTAALADSDGVLRFDEHAVRALLEGKNAIVIGPGMGTHDDAVQLVRFLLRETTLRIVVDADALTCLARDPSMLQRMRAQVLITPHPGEMARLLGTDVPSVQADRVATACAFATQHHCVVLLKGARTVIADPDGTVWINSTGNPGMASGGMGDALSGILGGLLAQGLSVTDAACLGAYLHGEVADHVAATDGQIGLLASDVIAGVPGGIQRLHRDSTSRSAT
jgi:NAD(P)H-hydrate epimerase